MRKMYVVNDTVTGVFSGIYDAWKEERTIENAGILIRGQIEQELFCEYFEVEESQHKAVAVERLIQKHMGYDTYWDIYHACLADDSGKGTAIWGVMQSAKTVKDSRKIMEHLSNPAVVKVFELSRAVANEAHIFKEFVRFKELDSGILISKIAPKAQILTCIAGHFANRLPLENWMICDKTHQMFLVHEARKQWILVHDSKVDMEKIEQYSCAENEYQILWKSFVESLAIKERKNLGLQRQHAPIYRRTYMVEFS